MTSLDVEGRKAKDHSLVPAFFSCVSPFPLLNPQFQTCCSQALSNTPQHFQLCEVTFSTTVTRISGVSSGLTGFISFFTMLHSRKVYPILFCSPLAPVCRKNLVVSQRWGWGIGKMGGGCQKVQTSGCKINESWGCMCNMVTIVNNTLSHIWKLLRE